VVVPPLQKSLRKPCMLHGCLPLSILSNGRAAALVPRLFRIQKVNPMRR
jgi:hypothetical protein